MGLSKRARAGGPYDGFTTNQGAARSTAGRQPCQPSSDHRSPARFPARLLACPRRVQPHTSFPLLERVWRCVCVWRGGLAATPSVAPARKVSTNIWTISAQSTTAYKTFELQRNEAHPWLFLQKGDVDTFFARFYTTPHALVGGYMTYYKNITPCWSIQRPQRLVVLYLHVLGH